MLIVISYALLHFHHLENSDWHFILTIITDLCCCCDGKVVEVAGLEVLATITNRDPVGITSDLDC